MEFATLRSGIQVPMVGYGVFRMDESTCERCVMDAFEAGYRMIDTAAAYRNETAVGRAVRASGIPREELFITTKLRRNLPGNITIDEFNASLDALKMDYVDLYLIHQPYGDVYSAWRTLEKILHEGRTRAIGVCNFDPVRLTDLGINQEIAPMINQIELHPFNQKQDWLNTCKNEGVVPMAWGPLAQGRKDLYTNPILVSIAQKHGKTVAQVVLRWHIQRGVIVIPKSQNRGRMMENINVFDFMLDDADMAAIAGLDEGNAKDAHADPAFVKMLCSGWK